MHDRTYLYVNIYACKLISVAAIRTVISCTLHI